MRRYALRDDQSERIKDLVRDREGHVGVTDQDSPAIFPLGQCCSQ
jgi:hypothetical protein